MAQNYPAKPIRLLVSPPGGGNDFVARIIAPGISGPLGQQVVIENRPTRGLADAIKNAPPDGYTIMVMAGGLWLFPFMADVNYDVIRDYAPITLAVRSPNVVVVHPSLPVKTVRDLVVLAKGRPGQINYSVGGLAGMSRLSVDLFKHMAGLSMTMVNYRSGTQEIADLVGGQVQLAFNPAGSATPHVRSGRLRGLAVTTADRSVLFPELPTVAASGFPGYEAVSVYSFFAPAKTPDAVVRRLNQEMVRYMRVPDVQQRFINGGTEAVASSPEELTTFIKTDMNRWGKFIRDNGIREE